jgi:hypothetical protein
VSTLKRRLRSLVIALAALALSAGVAMAGRGTLPSSVPTGQTATQGDQNEQGDQAEAPETEAPETEAPEAPETEAPDTNTGDTGTAGVHPDNHGLLVSQAAQTTTPTGFDNHGAYVKTVAQANHGHDQSAAATTKTHGKH